MEERTYEARINLLGLVHNLFLQDTNLICIFSIIKKKSLFFALSLRIGDPNYLSRKVVLLMPYMKVSLLVLVSGVPKE